MNSKLVLTVQVNNEPAPRIYSVDIPDGADVMIVNWTDVDETRNPLYPSAK